MSCGIGALHTKPEYGVDLSWVPTAFDVVTAELYSSTTRSPYNLSDFQPHEDGDTLEWVNVPYSPFNREWEDWMEMAKNTRKTREIHVRSVFVQGRVFTSDDPVFVRFRKYAGELGIPVGTLCILFCLLNPNVDKVIVGIDSEQQLRDDLRFFHRLDSFGVDDPNIIDPRKWS